MQETSQTSKFLTKMQQLTKQIFYSPFSSGAFSDLIVKQLFLKSAASRYGLLNKALKKKEVLKLRRGLYILSPDYSQRQASKLHLANQIQSFSYLSLETALSFHGWIPEQVHNIQSVINNSRTKSFRNEFGEFTYYKTNTNKYEFLTAVKTEQVDQQDVLIASPLRALTDLVYLRKINYKNITWLTDSLRIELDDLKTISEEEIEEMQTVYSSQRVQKFLKKLNKELAEID